jgi:hypothetical protein
MEREIVGKAAAGLEISEILVSNLIFQDQYRILR